MLGLTKTRRQADMRKSGPSGKRRARFFAAHRYRKSGPRKTALTGLRKKKNDCRYIDDTGACITPEARGGGLPPFKGIGRRSWKGHGESKEGAQRGNGKATKDRERVKRRPGAPQKSRLEGERTGWRGGEEPAGGGGKCRLRCMNTKKPAPSSGAGTLLGRSQIRASRHCQPSHARGWRTHA